MFLYLILIPVAFVKYTLSQLNGHCILNCIFDTFWRLETLVLQEKIVQNLLISVDLFCPENSRASSGKTSVTR